MITSCSPGWVRFAEKNYGDILEHLSSCKSPHQMFGAIIKSYFAEKYNIDISIRKHRAYCGKGMINGNKVVLVKPQTYMNLSGECVREIVDYYKVDEKSRLIVIYDDVSMDVGRLRIRKKGSAGGHNGIKNIILHLGHDVFQRIKIGVGEKPESYDLADYVLGHFTSEEVKKIKESAVLANEAVRLIVWDETEAAMNRFN